MKLVPVHLTLPLMLFITKFIVLCISGDSFGHIERREQVLFLQRYRRVYRRATRIVRTV